MSSLNRRASQRVHPAVSSKRTANSAATAAYTRRDGTVDFKPNYAGEGFMDDMPRPASVDSAYTRGKLPIPINLPEIETIEEGHRIFKVLREQLNDAKSISSARNEIPAVRDEAIAVGKQIEGRMSQLTNRIGTLISTNLVRLGEHDAALKAAGITFSDINSALQQHERAMLTLQYKTDIYGMRDQVSIQVHALAEKVTSQLSDINSEIDKLMTKRDHDASPPIDDAARRARIEELTIENETSKRTISTNKGRVTRLKNTRGKHDQSAEDKLLRTIGDLEKSNSFKQARIGKNTLEIDQLTALINTAFDEQPEDTSLRGIVDDGSLTIHEIASVESAHGDAVKRRLARNHKLRAACLKVIAFDDDASLKRSQADEAHIRGRIISFSKRLAQQQTRVGLYIREIAVQYADVQKVTAEWTQFGSLHNIPKTMNFDAVHAKFTDAITGLRESYNGSIQARDILADDLAAMNLQTLELQRSARIRILATVDIADTMRGLLVAY